MTLSARGFGAFRICLGIYLAIHFVMLVPYAGELFSSAGMLPDRTLFPTTGIFPDPFTLIPVGQEDVIVWLLFAMSLNLAAGIARRPMAILLWFGWAALFNRNILISNPSIPYVGWLLLAVALVPAGEAFCLMQKEKADWRFPEILSWGALLILGVGYTVSGLHKATSTSWQNGEALAHVLQLPLARDTWLRDLLLWLPPIFLKVSTWASLVVEILAGPLLLWKRTRPFIWLLLTGLQLGILCVVGFADLTVGMLLAHFFVFQPRHRNTRTS